MIHHMILRDIKGDNVTEDIKNGFWKKKKKEKNFYEVIQKLKNADYYHILD